MTFPTLNPHLTQDGCLAGSFPRQPPLGPPRQFQAVGVSFTFRVGELSEGGQRDDGVGDGVHQVQHAGDVVGAAGLDAADGVRLLLLEPEGTRAQEAMGKSDPALPQCRGPGRSSRWPGRSGWPGDSSIGEPVASTARPLGRDASGPFLQTGPGPRGQRHAP